MNETTLLDGTNMHVETLLSQLKDQVEQLLLLLSERERFVIEKRFALDGPERSTLEEIGQHFSVTRERVRQIEKNALQKLTRNINNFGLFEINNVAYEILKDHGGILNEDVMLSKLLHKDSGYTISALLFTLSLDKRFVRLSNTIRYVPYFRISELPEVLVERVSKKSVELLKKKGDVMTIDGVKEAVTQDDERASLFSTETFASLFLVHKGLKVMDGSVGLTSWKHINPRTLRDKIYFILRRNNKPLHFVDIANAIVESKFDRKNVNLQAVHNELIRHPDFILIGRGIYALKEWGFSSGTVADIIESILKGKEQMTEDEIIENVLKQRQVKPITIILNLKNKPQFIRVGRKRYTLKN